MLKLTSMNNTNNNNILPATITSIGNCAFMDCQAITNITLPRDLGKNITNGDGLGASVFENAIKLETVHFTGLDLRIINNRTFYNNVKLSHIDYISYTYTEVEANSVFDEEETYYTKSGNVYTKQEGLTAFEDGTTYYTCATQVVGANKVITLPTGITTIGDEVFYDNIEILKIVISNDLNTLGESVFSGTIKLNEITLPFVGHTREDSTTFGYNFGNNTALDSTKVSPIRQNGYECNIPDSLKTINITDSPYIKAYSFDDMAEVTTINITSDITSIGQYAFNGMSKLANFNQDTNGNNIVNDNVETIGTYAFANTLVLTNITLPSKLTTLGANAFRGAIKLDTVNFTGRLLTVLDDNTFYDDRSLKNMTYVDKDGNTVSATDVVYIPDTITTIKDKVFFNNVDMITIVIPNSVENIGASVLGGTGQLKNITTPFIGKNKTKNNVACDYTDNEKVIDSQYYVFGYLFGNDEGYYSAGDLNTVTQIYGADELDVVTYKIPSVENVTITDSVVLHYGVFSNVTTLKNVYINNKLTTIEDYAFYNTDKLEAVIASDMAITTIGESAFENSGIMTFAEANTVGAFSVFDVDSEETFNSLKTMLYVVNNDGDYVKATTYDANATYYATIGVDISTLASIGDNAFKNANRIVKISIPQTLGANNGDYVGVGAFRDMDDLQVVEIANKIISDYMFYNDPKVKEIVVPSDATSIGEAAFGQMTALESLTIPFVGKTYNATNGLEASEKVLGYLFGIEASSRENLEYGVTQNGTTYQIPVSLATITVTNDTILSADALRNLTHVTTITLPNENTNKFATISEYAVANTGITEFVIPATVQTINNHAFYHNDNLAKVTYLGELLTVIDEYVFAENPVFTTFVNTLDNTDYVINIPASVTTIKAHAFENSISAGSIAEYDIKLVLPDALGTDTESTVDNTLGAYAFSGTTKLDKVDFGASKITTIGAHAFDGSGITTIYVANDGVNTFNPEVSEIADYAFNNTKLAGSLTIPVTITELGEYTFSNITTQLTNIAYNSNITGKHMFENDSNIDTVVFNTTTLTTIEDYAFINTTSLENIELPEELEVLGEEAFCNSKLGNTTTLPEGLTTIKRHALANNKYTSIVVPDSVIYIGYGAFSGNGALTEMTLPFIGSYHPNHIPANATGSETLFGYIFGRESYTDGVQVTQFMKDNGEVISFTSDISDEPITEDKFYIPKGLVRVEISEHINDQSNRIKEITKGQFSGVTTLHNVILPYRLETIREGAFSGATGLYYVDIPETVMTLERAVFENINEQFFIVVYYSLEWEAANPNAVEEWKRTASISHKIRPNEWYYNVDSDNKPITEDSAWYTHYIVYYDQAYNIFRYEYNYSNTKSTWTIVGYYEDALKAYVAAHKATGNGNQFVLPIPGSRGGHDVVEIKANAFYNYFADYHDNDNYSIDGLDIANNITKIGQNAVYGTDDHQLNIYIRKDKDANSETGVYNEENWIAGNALVYYGYGVQWVKNDYYYQIRLGNTDVTQIQLSETSYEYQGVYVEPTTEVGILDPIKANAYQPETLTVISTATKIGDAVRPTFTIGTHFRLEYENNFHASTDTTKAIVRVVEIQTNPFFAKDTYRDIVFEIEKAPLTMTVVDEQVFEEGTYWSNNVWDNSISKFQITGYKNEADVFTGTLSTKTVIDTQGFEETNVNYVNGEVLPYTEFNDFFWRVDWSVVNTTAYEQEETLTDDYYIVYDLEVLIKQKEILVYWSNTSVEHADNLTLPTPKVYIKAGYDPLEVVPLTIAIYDIHNNLMGTHMNIGSYTVIASTINTNYKLIGSKSSYDIAKTTISLPSMNNRIVYNGDDQAVLLTPAAHFDYWYVEGYVQYTDPENQTLIKVTDLSEVTLRDAGTYYIYAIIGDEYSVNYQWRYYIDELYRDSTYELQMFVYPRDLVIKIDNKEVKISNDEIKFPIEDGMVSNLIEGDSVSGYLSVDGTATGYYYSNQINTDNLIITNKDGKPENYNIVIDATINVVYPNIAEVTSVRDYIGDYDKQAHGIIVELDTEIANTAIVRYCTTNSQLASDWSTTPITYTDAGEYSVYYRITNSGYNDLSGIASITINKIDSTVTITQTVDTKEYDGNNFNIAYTYSAGLDGAFDTHVEYYYNGSMTAVDSAINAGNWVAVVVVDGNGNYNETRKEYPFTITPKVDTNAQIAYETGYLGGLGRYSYESTVDNIPNENLIPGDKFYIEFTINDSRYVLATDSYSQYTGKTFYNKVVNYSIVTFDEETVYEPNKYYSFTGTDYILINNETMPDGDIYRRTENYVEIQLDSTSYIAGTYYVERESACGEYRYSDGGVIINVLQVLRGTSDVTYNYDLDTLISEFYVDISRSAAQFRYSGTLYSDEYFLKIYDEDEFDGAAIIRMSSSSSKPLIYYYFNSEEDANGTNGAPDLTKAISAPINYGTYYVRCYVDGDFNTENGWSDVYKIKIEKRTLETWTPTTVFEYTGNVIMPVINIREYSKDVPLTYTITSGNGKDSGNHEVTVSLTTPNDNYILDENNSVYSYTIERRNVTIRIIDDVDYTGDYWTLDITNSKAHVTNVAEGQTISGIIKSKDYRVGTYSTDNKFDITDLAIKDSNNNDVTSNYRIALNITVKVLYPYVEYTVTNGVEAGFEANKYYRYDSENDEYVLIDTNVKPECDIYSAEYSYEEVELTEETYEADKYYIKNGFGAYIKATGEYSDYYNETFYEQGVGYTKIKYNKYVVSYEYDGLKHFAEVIPQSSGATVTYTYGGRTTVSRVGLTDVGRIDIIFKITKNDSRTTEGVITLEITQAELSIVPTFTDEFDNINMVVTKQYTSRQFEFAYSVVNRNGEEVEFDVSSSVSYYRPGIRTYKLTTPSRIGEYDVVVEVAETTNYTGTPYEFTLVIVTSDVPIDITDSQLTTTYSGFAVNNPYVTTYSRNAKVIYEYFQETENGRISLGHSPILNVGTYELEVTVEGEYEIFYVTDENGDYVLDDNNEKIIDHKVAIGFCDTTKTFEFTVTPLARVVTWTNTSNTYGNKENIEDYVPRATYADVYGVTQSASVTTNIEYIKAGDYTATAESLDSNYR